MKQKSLIHQSFDSKHTSACDTPQQGLIPKDLHKSYLIRRFVRSQGTELNVLSQLTADSQEMVHLDLIGYWIGSDTTERIPP